MQHLPSHAIGGNAHGSSQEARPQRSEGFASWQEARRTRLRQEENVLKLQNRIQVLKKEEEIAVKKMEDTRKKAEEMLRFKSEKEEYVRRRLLNHQTKMLRAKELIQLTNEGRLSMRQSKVDLESQNKQHVQEMKKEAKLHRKQRSMLNKAYIQRIQ